MGLTNPVSPPGIVFFVAYIRPYSPLHPECKVMTGCLSVAVSIPMQLHPEL
jgi:hypothetical protein